MPGQSEKLIEYVAHINNIDLQNAPLEKLLYVYALTFREIHKRLSDDIINFPQDSLEEIVEAFTVIINFFNAMQPKSMDRTLANDIKFARKYLVKARGCANTAVHIIRTVDPDSIKYYEVFPLYQEHLQNCAIYVVDINNHIESWLQQNP